MIKLKNYENEKILEVITSTQVRYNFIIEFNNSDYNNQYSIKNSEGLYIFDNYNNRIYKLIDSITLKNNDNKLVFKMVENEEEKSMIINL